MATPYTDRPFSPQATAMVRLQLAQQGAFNNGQHRRANPSNNGGPHTYSGGIAGAFSPIPAPAYSRDDAEARHRAIENTGLTVGEITAWRTWRVRDGYLVSPVVVVYWAPREAMQGDVIENGVYAFKRKTDALNEYTVRCGEVAVLGQVALWGEVVEHEHGYRAEFGKPLTLDAIYPETPENIKQLEALRVRYF